MIKSTDNHFYSEAQSTFGDRLVAAREAQGLSQAELAKNLGIANRTLNAWENNTSEPRANKLQMLSGLLNVSVSWLLIGEGDGIAPQAAPETAAVLEEIRALQAQMVDAAERLAELERQLRQPVAVLAAE